MDEALVAIASALIGNHVRLLVRESNAVKAVAPTIWLTLVGDKASERLAPMIAPLIAAQYEQYRRGASGLPFRTYIMQGPTWREIITTCAASPDGTLCVYDDPTWLTAIRNRRKSWHYWRAMYHCDAVQHPNINHRTRCDITTAESPAISIIATCDRQSLFSAMLRGEPAPSMWRHFLVAPKSMTNINAAFWRSLIATLLSTPPASRYELHITDAAQRELQYAARAAGCCDYVAYKLAILYHLANVGSFAELQRAQWITPTTVSLTREIVGKYASYFGSLARRGWQAMFGKDSD